MPERSQHRVSGGQDGCERTSGDGVRSAPDRGQPVRGKCQLLDAPRWSRLWINPVLDRTMRSRVRSTRKKPEVFKVEKGQG